MSQPEIQETYKERAASSESVHADLRSQRGLDHIASIALLMALTYNALRVISNGWM